jgi:hypothetical protein
VGAWWIGFLVSGVLTTVSALPLALFPKRMPHARPLAEESQTQKEQTATDGERTKEEETGTDEKRTKAEETVTDEKRTKEGETVTDEKRTKAEETVTDEKRTKEEETVTDEKRTKEEETVDNEKQNGMSEEGRKLKHTLENGQTVKDSKTGNLLLLQDVQQQDDALSQSNSKGGQKSEDEEKQETEVGKPRGEEDIGGKDDANSNGIILNKSDASVISEQKAAHVPEPGSSISSDGKEITLLAKIKGTYTYIHLVPSELFVNGHVLNTIV